MIKNKKIVFCIDSLEKGGAERVVSVLANSFIENNEVYIVTIVNEKIQYELNSKVELIELGKEGKKHTNKILKKILFIPNFIHRLRKMKKSFKNIEPDIIISFLPEACFFSIMANKRKYKIIVSDRNDPNQEYKTFLYKFLMKKLYPKADGYVFQTINAKEYFDNIINFKQKKYDIIVNPVNPDFKKCPLISVRKKNIVSVGRLTEQKNMELLIDSFYDICNKFPEYTLTIYGEGNKRDELEEKIKKLKLENRVFLPGVVNNLKDAIYDSTIFVMSSNYEGIPNALIEAMTLGLPVISTDCPCGGPRMFIKNGENGFLVEVNNRKKLAETMELLLENDDLREKIKKNATDIIKEVDINIINKKWDNFIKLVIGDEKI